jgi:hypothetical protein
MPISWEEKKNIRRQLTQNLGRTPTNEEFEAALLPKHFSSGMDITNPEHWSRIYNTITGEEDESPGKLASSFVQDERGLTKSQGTLLDESLKKDKDEGKKLVPHNENLLNLKPFSLERPSGTAEDLIGLVPKPTAEIQTPYDSALQPMSEESETPKLPTDEEQLRDIYLKQGDFTYPKEKASTASGQLKNQKNTSLEDDEFKKASQQADYNQAQARLMSAVGGLSTSLANLGNIGTPIDNKFKEGTDDLLKHAGDPLTRLKEKRAMYEELIKNRELEEDRNPSSKKSIAYRELAKGLGMQVRGDETAADLAKLINVATQKYQSDQAKEDRSLRYAELKADKDERKKMRMEDFTKGIRKEITTSKSYESALAGKRITSTLQDFSKNPTGYSDYGTLMGALRSLQGDDSVIREAEIRLGMGAGSLMDKIQNEWSKAVSGKMLTTKQRNDIINAAKIMAKEALNNFKVHSQPSLTQAEKLGIPKQEILPELESEVSTTEFPRTVKKEGKIATVKNQQELKEALAEGWQ